MKKKVTWIILFLFLFSCHETEELKSKAPPEYKDAHIKFIYVLVEDLGRRFFVEIMQYCYKAIEHYETDYKFPMKTVKVEVYDEDDNILNVSPIIKTYTQEQDYPIFILTIPYQEEMGSFNIFRLDKKREKISYEIYKKLLKAKEREKEELDRQELEEEKKLKREEEAKAEEDRKEWEEWERREEWEKKWENKRGEWREGWNKKIITEPLRKKLRYNYKTLDYNDTSKCHYIDYSLFN